MSDPRPTIPNVNWADHPGTWVDYLREDRAWLIQEVERLEAALVEAYGVWSRDGYDA